MPLVHLHPSHLQLRTTLVHPLHCRQQIHTVIMGIQGTRLQMFITTRVPETYTILLAPTGVIADTSITDGAMAAASTDTFIVLIIIIIITDNKTLFYHKKFTKC